MCLSRGTAPGSKFESWYKTTMERLSSKDDPLIPLEMDPIFASNVGIIGKSNVVFESKAWQSESLRYVRLISFVGEGYDVFNFLAIPRSGVALPILGIDVVSLPRGSLAAIDFQPQTADPLVFDSDLYSPLKEVQNKFTSLLPSGGDFPEEAKRYFSPLAIWTRIPGSSSVSSSNSSVDGSSSSAVSDPIQLMSVVGDALDSYVQEYAILLSEQKTIELSSKSNNNNHKIDETFLNEYLAYRTSKDPAKRLLVGAFGAEWTENVLTTIMFPTHTQDIINSNENLAANVPGTITFVTGNAKKRMEVEAILEGYNAPFKLVSEKIDLPELQGEPLEIAIQKCRLAVDKLGGPVITEDTSLCFHALQGLPGPYIKWFLEKLGHVGLNNLLAAYPDKSAYAQCIVAYCAGPGQEIKTFVGRTEGHIVPAKINPGSGEVFGWDPIFRPLLFQDTYAQIPKEIKNKISHRFKAFAQLSHYLGGKSL